MKRLCSIIILFAVLVGMTACGNKNQTGQRDASSGATSNKETNSSVTSNDEADTMKRNNQSKETTNILVAYFSCTGTTKPLAEYAAGYLNADLYEIVAETPYTSEDLDYNKSNSRVNKEQEDANARPAISGKVENMDQYTTVVLAYPIWLAYHNLIQCTQA